MAKKSTTKKSLKSLFSKSEVNLDETVAALAESGSGVDKKKEEKKKFKFPTLKIKSKNSGSSERIVQESVQVPSVEKPGGDSSADNVSTDTDRSSLYATAPRSKVKELSASEMDLTSKPKRFNTFSLELPQETPSDLSQMPLAKPDTKTMSMSQPELDTSEIFDIPSPPRIAVKEPDVPLTSQSEASVTVHPQPIKTQPTNIQNTTTNQSEASVTVHTQPIKTQPVNIHNTTTGQSEASVTVHPQPIKTQPTNIQNTTTNQSEASVTVHSQPIKTQPVNIQNTTTSQSEASVTVHPQPIKTQPTNIQNTAVQTPKAPIATIPELQLDDEKVKVLSKVEEALPNFTVKSNDATLDASNIRVSTAKDEAPFILSAQAEKQPGINATGSKMVPAAEKELELDPKMATNAIKVSTIDSKVATNPETVANSLDKQVDSSGAIGNTAKVDAKVDAKANDAPVISSYDKSNFDSMATTPKIPQNERIKIKTTQLNVVEQDKMYRKLYDTLFPENFTQEVVSSILNEPTKVTEYKSIETITETVFVKRYEESERISAPLSTSSPEKIDVDSLSSFASANEFITTKSEEKSPTRAVCIRTKYDSTFDYDKPLIQDNKFAYSEFNTETSHDKELIAPSSLTEKDPPLLSYAPSQETSAQVSADSKRKVVLVKELVSNESAGSSISGKDSGCPTPVMEKISTSLDLRNEEPQVLSFAPEQTELHDGICSPAYLSVGSDDGSAMEVYFSAEEDNADDLFTPEATVIDTTRDASVLEDTNINRTLVLKEDMNVSENSAAELRQEAEKLDGNGMLAAAQVTKERNERKEEFLTTPVGQVKEFEVVPPFKEESGAKEGLGISQSDSKDASFVDKSLENVSKHNPQLESLNAADKFQITSKFAEEAELVLTTRKDDERGH
ncbi:hypothetical protein WMY93_020121 [Mugilogobius chulae]|uniref:Uncharacterized protein n=1 Tax=Mugilogobius chulae TaxID=88201 RepID=A0AAW0NJ30_9GOBI